MKFIEKQINIYKITRYIFIFSIALSSVFLTRLWAQEAQKEAKEEQSVEKEKEPPPGISTPRRALYRFIVLARDNKFTEAAEFLDLDKEKIKDGPTLARKLKFVLDQKLWIDFDLISNQPHGNKEDKSVHDTIGNIELEGQNISIVMSKYGTEPTHLWKFTKSTVEKIPALYEEYGPGVYGMIFPQVMFSIRIWELYLWQYVGLIAGIFIAWLLARVLAAIILSTAHRISSKTTTDFDDRLIEAVKKPLRLFIILILQFVLISTLRFSVPAQAAAFAILQTLMIINVVWFLLRTINFLAETLRQKLTSDAEDELRVRGVRTQVIVLRRIAHIIIIVIGTALVLSQFEVVRQVGMSLLASAGIAGLVFGLAAQKPISSLLSGIQLAITQPVRIGDTVIVEGEWGQIEEINLTYVVIKIWDLRRLIVPMNAFLEKPFQNWTKVSPDLLGTIEVFADYTVPVEKVREHLNEVVKDHPDWDGVAVGVQVTGVSEHTVKIRGLISAADASKQWNLRCDMREALVEYLRELEGGRYLPRYRFDGKP